MPRFKRGVPHGAEPPPSARHHVGHNLLLGKQATFAPRLTLATPLWVFSADRREVIRLHLHWSHTSSGSHLRRRHERPAASLTAQKTAAFNPPALKTKIRFLLACMCGESSEGSGWRTKDKIEKWELFWGLIFVMSRDSHVPWGQAAKRSLKSSNQEMFWKQLYTPL